MLKCCWLMPSFLYMFTYLQDGSSDMVRLLLKSKGCSPTRPHFQLSLFVNFMMFWSNLFQFLLPNLLGYESRYCPTLIKIQRKWSWVLSHIDEIKGFEHVYKLVSYSTYCQLVLEWNLIWACLHCPKESIDLQVVCINLWICH